MPLKFSEKKNLNQESEEREEKLNCVFKLINANFSIKELQNDLSRG
jgi:hypothetical protein